MYILFLNILSIQNCFVFMEKEKTEKVLIFNRFQRSCLKNVTLIVFKTTVYITILIQIKSSTEHFPIFNE